MLDRKNNGRDKILHSLAIWLCWLSRVLSRPRLLKDRISRQSRFCRLVEGAIEALLEGKEPVMTG